MLLWLGFGWDAMPCCVGGTCIFVAEACTFVLDDDAMDGIGDANADDVVNVIDEDEGDVVNGSGDDDAI